MPLPHSGEERMWPDCEDHLPRLLDALVRTLALIDTSKPKPELNPKPKPNPHPAPKPGALRARRPSCARAGVRKLPGAPRTCGPNPNP